MSAMPNPRQYADEASYYRAIDKWMSETPGDEVGWYLMRFILVTWVQMVLLVKRSK